MHNLLSMSLPFYDLDAFVTHLRAGGVGVLPTDTVPGLVVLPEQAEAIYGIKERDPDRPLILLGASAGDLRPYTRGWLPAWSLLANRGWPGPLTLVLPASDRVIPAVNRSLDTVGLRVPNHEAARALLERTGPLASTSVNRSGEPPLLTPEQIQAVFPDLPLLEGDYTIGGGTASTVVRWQEPEWQWEVLRQGKFHL